ncbi:dTMP kinase [Goodfellowiella coeruleoviolacea]|uniref:Thymidylate kinase n=1 Tax=Goodfellowiella coeruleoviolacea TaxID=334858 RepID=A0AAE3KH55_9PSEU|nr:dTMP kinase [Goodfellowiella coeruleoviolacea]MCP2167961.1 dTMP kinase [Goodfellowiella coeruleoviolacea]
MGRLVVIEGVDGAGKRTLAQGLTDVVTERGGTVARLAFPRYDDDVHAQLVRDALHGRLGGLGESVYGMGVLYALDRRAAADEVRDLLRHHDLVLLDRYTASNAAYGAARLRQDADGEFVRWVWELEVDRFGLPVPDAHLLLRVPAEVAAERAARREREEADRARDNYETDAGLQRRCAAVYEGLAERNWLAPWRVLDGTSTVDHRAVVDALEQAVAG